MSEIAAKLGEFDFAGDDRVVPFQILGLDARGRAVQLGGMLDTILGRHDYPEPVARLLAEMIVLTVLLGTSLKFDGKLIVQTQTDGPVDLLVADFASPDSVRAYARYDDKALAEAVARNSLEPQELLGKGILAFTIDQGPYMQRYQGIVELDGASLEEIATAYFRQSEQIPTEGAPRRGRALRARRGRRGASLACRRPRRPVPAGGPRAHAAGRPARRRRSGRRRPARIRGGRSLGGGQDAGRHHRHRRADRSPGRLRAAPLPPVPRTAACGSSSPCRCSTSVRARATGSRPCSTISPPRTSRRAPRAGALPSPASSARRNTSSCRRKSARTRSSSTGLR